MTVLQAKIIKDAMREFGIEMEHEFESLGRVWFCADVSGLRRLLEEEEYDVKSKTMLARKLCFQY